MSRSVWGVEHAEEISKKREPYTSREKKIGLGAGVSSATLGLGPVVGGIAAGHSAKKGYGRKVGFRAAGRGIAEGTAYGLGTGGLVALATRGRSPGATRIATGLGSATGVGTGAANSMRNSRKKGWMKES